MDLVRLNNRRINWNLGIIGHKCDMGGVWNRRMKVNGKLIGYGYWVYIVMERYV